MRRGLALACACACAAASAAWPAEAPAHKMRLKILGVDVSRFPDIAVDVQPFAESGSAVKGLTADNVRVLEDGAEFAGAKLRVQRLADLGGEPSPRMSVVMAIVNTKGLDREAVGKALWGLVSKLTERDEACVAIQRAGGEESKAEEVGVVRPKGRLWQRFTNHRKILAIACRDYDLERACMLYEVLMFALSVERPNFCPIVVVSDGFDQGSRFNKGQVIAKAQEMGRPIFCIGVETGLFKKRFYPASLIDLAQRTGGKYYRFDGKTPMTWLYDDMKAFRETQYRITYRSTNFDPERLVRHVTVQATVAGFAPTSASAEVTMPRDRVWAERQRQAKLRREALTSGAEARLMDGRAALADANVKIVEAVRLGSEGKFKEAEARFAAAGEAVARARQAARDALARVEKIHASSEEADNDDVRQALALAEKQRREAAKIQRDADDVQRTLEMQRAALAVRRLAAREETVPPDSPELVRALDAVAAHRADMKPEVYADVHRLLSGILMGHALKLVDEGRYDAAAEVCEKILDKLPDDAPGATNADAYAVLGRCDYEAGRYAQAEKHYREAIKRQPRNAEARLGLARALRKLKRPADALKEALAAEKTAPKNADLHRLIGELAYESQQYELAARYLALAERACPAVRPMLADSYERLGRTEQAIATYRSIVADSAATARDYARLVWLLWRTGQTDQPDRLIGYCRLALESEKLSKAERARTLNVLGICLYNKGAWDEGVRRCVDAVRLAPELRSGHPVLR